MSTLPDVDLILGVYNQPHLAANCIESLQANTNYPRWRLLIVDDHSDEITHAVLEKYASRYANIVLYRNEKNLGFGGTYNRGVSLSNAKYVVLMNSDIMLPPRWLERLVEVAEADPSVALVNPLSNEVVNFSLPMAPGASYLAMYDLLNHKADKGVFDIVTAVGYCLLIRREALDRHGALDDVYGHGYYEDSDLHMRLTSYGWRSVAAPNVYVYHLHSGTFPSAKVQELSRKNSLIFMDRWGERYHKDLERFQAADPMKKIRDIFQVEAVRRKPLFHFIKMCKRAIGLIIKKRRKLIAMAFQPRRAMAAIMHRLNNYKNLAVMAEIASPQHLKFKLTRRYLDQNTRHHLPSVVFVLEGLVMCGGCMKIIELVNQLLLLGIEARVAVANRNCFDPQCLHGALFSPMCFDDHEDLMQNFPHCDVAIATFWPTAPLVRKLADAGIAQTAVYYLQDFEAWFYKDKKKQREVLDTYHLIDHCVATSKWLRDMLLELGFDAKVIPLGFDALRFYPRAREKHSKVRVIAMARPETPHRGFEDVIAAFRHVHQQRPDVEFLLYGSSALRQYGDLGFPYTDLGFIIDRSELCKHYNDSDIFLDASHFQGFGLPALEAMACQAACVLTNLGGVNEYAIDEVNSLLVTPHNPKACSEAILRLVRDGELRRRLGAEGRKTVENMTLKDEAEAWLDFLAERCPSFKQSNSQERKLQAVI